MPGEAEALSPAERERRLAEIEDRLLDAERAEEALVEAMIADGRDVARRLDADPRAILGVAVGRLRAKAA